MRLSLDSVWWVGQPKGLGNCSWACPKTCIFVDFLVCQQRLQWRCGTWWRTTIASPLAPSSSIFCRRLHICKLTLQMMRPIMIIGGEWPKDNSQVHVAIYWFGFWIGWSSGKLIVVYYCLNEPLLTFHFSLQIVFENRKEWDVKNDCLLLVDGTDFHLAMGYSKPFYDYKFKRSGYRYKVGLCIKTGNICWWNGHYKPSD